MGLQKSKKSVPEYSDRNSKSDLPQFSTSFLNVNAPMPHKNLVPDTQEVEDATIYGKGRGGAAQAMKI
jgi:hypothetical protein